MIRSRSLSVYLLAGFFLLAQSASANPNATRLTANGAVPSEPMLEGELVGWTDYRDGASDVYVLDRASGIEHRVTDSAGEDRLLGLSGTRLLILSDADLVVCSFDRASGACAPEALTFGAYNPGEASLDGDRVVWFDAGLDPSILDDRLVIANLSDGSRTYYYPPANTAIGHPQFAGERILFESVKGKKSRIESYDLATGKVKRIHASRIERGLPAASGDRVVWSEGDVETADVRMYDFAAQKSSDRKRWASQSAGGQLAPRIAGDRMVWEDMRDGQGEVYHCNLRNGIETQVAPSGSSQHQPFVHGDEVVWVEDDGLFIAALPAFQEPEVESNRIQNAGFEDAKQNWSGFSKRKQLTSDTAFNGSSAVRFDLGTGVLVLRQSGIIELDAAGDFRIRAGLRTEGVSGVAMLEVEWKNAKGKTLRVDSFGHATGDTPWTVIGEDAFASPPDAAKAIVRLVTTRGAGSAYFDDVRFENADQ